MANWKEKIFPYPDDIGFMFLFCIVLFVPIVFSNFTYEKFETIKLSLFSILVGCALLSTKTIHYNRKLVILIGLFLLFGMLATIFAPDKFYSFFGKDYLWQGFYFFILWAILILLFVSKLDKQKLVHLMKVSVLVGLANSIWSILEMYGFGWYWDFSQLERVFLRSPGFTGNPNYTGMFLTVITMFCIYLITEAKNFKTKSYYSISLIIIIWGMMVISSRGAIIALFGMLLVAGILTVYTGKRKYWKLLAATFILGGTLLILFTPLIRNAESLNRPDELDVAQNNIVLRFNTYVSAWNVFLHHPVIGIGWGNNAEVHDVFLNFLVIGGLPILLIFLFLFEPLPELLWKIYNKKRDSDDVSLEITIICSVLGFFASALFNPVSLTNWIMLAFLLAGLYVLNEKKDYEWRIIWKPLAFIFVVFGFVFFVSQWLMLEGLRTVMTPNNSRAYKLLSASYSIFPWVGQLQANLYLEEIALKRDPLEITAGINKMIRLHPHDENSYIRAGQLYHFLYIETNEKKYYDISLDNMTQAMNISPFRYGSGPAAGYAYNEKDYDKSMKFILVAIMAHDTNAPIPDVWLYLANIYMSKGNQKAAVIAIREAYITILDDSMPNPAKFYLKRILNSARNGKKLETVPIPGQTGKEILI
jgi:tetratricopeptide (TPR) repeat protein